MARSIFNGISTFVCVIVFLLVSTQFAATDSDERVKNQATNTKRTSVSLKDSMRSADSSGRRTYEVDDSRSGRFAVRGSSNFGNESESPALNTFLENVLRAQNELKWIDHVARGVNHRVRSNRSAPGRYLATSPHRSGLSLESDIEYPVRLRGKRGFDENSGTAWLPQKRKYANGSTSVTPERVYLEKEMAYKRNADWDDFGGIDRYRHRLNRPVYEKGTMDDQPLKDWTSGEGPLRSTSYSLNPNRDLERGRDNRLDRWPPDYEAAHKSGTVDELRNHGEAFDVNYPKSNARDERETRSSDEKPLNPLGKSTSKEIKTKEVPLSLGSLEKMVVDLKKSLKNTQRKMVEKTSGSTSHENDRRREHAAEQQRKQHKEAHIREINTFVTGNTDRKSSWWNDPRPAEEIFDFKRRASDPEDRGEENIELKEWIRKRAGHENDPNEEDPNTLHRTVFEASHHQKQNSGDALERKRRSNGSVLNREHVENEHPVLSEATIDRARRLSNITANIDEPRVDFEDIIDLKTNKRLADTDSSKTANTYVAGNKNLSTTETKDTNMPEIFGMSAANGPTDFHVVGSSENREGKNDLKGEKSERNEGERSSALSPANSDSAYNSSTDRSQGKLEDNSLQTFELAAESESLVSTEPSMNTVAAETTREKGNGIPKAERKMEANVEPIQREEVIKVFQPQGRLHQDTQGIEKTDVNDVDERRKLSQQASGGEEVNVDAALPVSDARIMKDSLIKKEGGSYVNEAATGNGEVSMRKFDMERRTMTQESQPNKVVATSVNVRVHQVQMTPSEGRQDQDAEEKGAGDQSKLVNSTSFDDSGENSKGIDSQDENQKKTQVKETIHDFNMQQQFDEKLNVDDSNEFFEGLSRLAKNLSAKNNNEERLKLIKSDNDLISANVNEPFQNWQRGREQEQSAENQREFRYRNLVHDPRNENGRIIDRSEIEHSIDTGFAARDKNRFNFVEIKSPNDKAITKVITGSDREKSNERSDKQFSEALENSINNHRNRYINDRDKTYISVNDLSNSRYEVSNHDEDTMIAADYLRNFDTKPDEYQNVADDNSKRVDGSTRKLLWAFVSSLEDRRADAEGKNDAKKYANGDMEGVENYVEEEEKAIDDESGNELRQPVDREVRSLNNEETNPLKAKVDMLIKQRMRSKDRSSRDYVRKRRYPMGTIEYYDYDSEIDGQDEKASAIGSKENRDNFDNGSVQSAIKLDRENGRAGSGTNETCKSDTLAGVKKNEHAEEAMKEERERAKLKNKVPKEEFIADLGQARHTNSTGKTQKPSSFSGTRSVYEREKMSDAEEQPQMIFQGEDAPSDIYRGRSQLDIKSINEQRILNRLDRTVESELHSLKESGKAAENDGKEILLDEPLEYVLSVHDSLEPVEVGDFLEDAHPISLSDRSKELDSSGDVYDDYDVPRYRDHYYRDIGGTRRNMRPLYEELKKVYDWNEAVKDRPRFRGDLRMRFEMDDNIEGKNVVPSMESDRNSSNTSKSNYLALKSTDDLFKSGIEQSNPSDDRKIADEKTTVWKVMKVDHTDSPNARITTAVQSFLEQRKYPETDSLSPYANPKYIESIKSQHNPQNVAHGKRMSFESKDLHESFVDPVDAIDDLDDDVKIRLGRSLMTIENSAILSPRKTERIQWLADDTDENSLWDIEGIENDLFSYLPESSLAKIRVKRQSIEGDLKQSAAKKYSRNRHAEVEGGTRLNQVQEKNANAERDLVHGKIERDIPSSEDVIDVSLNNAKRHENFDGGITKEIALENARGIVTFDEESNSNSADRSNAENLLDDDALRLKRDAVNYRTFYDDVNEGWRDTDESSYNRYLADKMNADDHPRLSDLYDHFHDQHVGGYFIPQWREEPLSNNSIEDFDQDSYGKVIRSASSKKEKFKKQRSSKVAKKRAGTQHKKKVDRHHKRSSHDSEENLEDDDWKLDEDVEIMDPFSSETDKPSAKIQNLNDDNSAGILRKTRKSDDDAQRKKLQTLLAVDDMKDESQMNMALHGELAGKIVAKIFEQVQNNEALKVALGPGLYRKHRPEDVATVNKNYRQELDQDEIKHTEAMMRRVMELLGRLVLDEVQRKTCASLPPDMKDFLHWMLGVDKGQETLEEAPPLPHVRHEQTSEHYPDNKFLFHGAANNEPDPELAELYDKVRLLRDLINEYNTLPENEKMKVRTVYDYLERQVNLLLDYIRTKEMKEADMKDVTSIAGARSRSGNILQYQSAIPNRTNERNMTMPESFAPVVNIPGLFTLNNTMLNGDYQNSLSDIDGMEQSKYRKIRSIDNERKRKKHKKRKRKRRKHRKHKDDFGRSKYQDTIHDVGVFRRKRANLKENEWNPFGSSHDGLVRDDKGEFVNKETDVLRDNNNVSSLYWENVLAKNRESAERKAIDAHMSTPKEYYSLRGLKTDELGGDALKNNFDEASNAKYQELLPIKGKDPIDDEVLLLTKREAWKRANERELEEVAFGKDMRSNAKEEEQFRRLTEIDKRKNIGLDNRREKRDNMAMSMEQSFNKEDDTPSNVLTDDTMTNYTGRRNRENESNEIGQKKVSNNPAKIDAILLELPSGNDTCKRHSWSNESHEDNDGLDDDEKLKMLERKINVYPDRTDEGLITKNTAPRKESINLENGYDGGTIANHRTLIP